MSSSPVSLTGLSVARAATRRTWLVLAAAAVVPGWAGGRAMVGFATVGDRPLADHAPNIWSIVERLPWLGALPLAGLAMASAIGAAAWLAAHFAARLPRDPLAAALLIALALPGLLPGITPGDFFLAGILGAALAIHRRNRANLTPAGLVAIGILLSFAGLAPLGAVPTIVATVLICRRFLVSPANDNGLPLHPNWAYPAGHMA